MLELFLDNIFGSIASAIGLFGGAAALKYLKLAKELKDVYFSYTNMVEDGKNTKEEKLKFADEVIDVIEAGKAIKTKKKVK